MQKNIRYSLPLGRIPFNVAKKSILQYTYSYNFVIYYYIIIINNNILSIVIIILYLRGGLIQVYNNTWVPYNTNHNNNGVVPAGILYYNISFFLINVCCVLCAAIS